MRRPGIALALVGAVAIAAAGLWWQFGGGAARDGIDIADAAFVDRGRTLYAQHCASCHGAELQGQVPDWRSRLPDGSIPAPPHDASGHTWHHPDAMLFEITKLGRLKASGGAAMSNMPGFEDKLSDADIWAVLSYIKSTWPEPVRQRHDELNRRAQAH